jgi:tetratricopeptide (TPR) repeat protein
MLVISLLLILSGAALAQTAEGVRLFHEGKYLEAEAALKKTLSAGEDPTATAFLALTQAATGRCQQAEAALHKSFEQADAADIRRLTGLGLARCLTAAKKFDDSLAVLYRLKALYPNDADVLYETARGHLKAWNGLVYEMFEKTPASFRVNQLSAEVFEIQGQYSEAAGEYRKAIEKNPDALNLHYRLGRALLMQSHEPGALAEARKQFEAELALNPNDAVAEYQVGQILLTGQKPAEATPHFERTVELDGNFAEALIALGRIRSQQRNFGEAIRLLERAVELAPESEGAHYNLMLAYRNAGRREDAQKQKARLDELQKAPEGEFTDFLKRIGQAPAETK